MPLYRGSRRLILARRIPAVVGGANLTNLDGSVHAAPATGGTSYTLSLTTTKTNDVIVVCILNNAANNNSVASASAGSFTKRGSTVGHNEVWTAFSSSILSGDTITLTTSADPGFLSWTAFAVNGAPSSSYFDANGGLPATTVSSTPASITTSNANDFLFTTYTTDGTTTAGSGWTLISGNDFQNVQYKIVSANQSSLSAPIGTGNIASGIGDAIISA